MTFRKRRIEFEIRLGKGDFGEDGFDTVNVSGLRAQTHITIGGGPSMGEAQIRIYGLKLELLNKLSALTQYSMILRSNTAIITAGDDVDGMRLVFRGAIAQGWADLNAQPDAALMLSCYAGIVQKMKPVDASSYPDQAAVVDIMSDLAEKMNLEFENNGVSVVLATPYYPGALWEQAQRCAQAANINVLIDENVLAIWPKNGSRFGDKPLISKETGMVGYPSYNGVGVSITTLFDPRLRFGGLVEVQSDIKNTNGTWVITGLSHDLSCETPGGEWFTHFEARPLLEGQILL